MQFAKQLRDRVRSGEIDSLERIALSEITGESPRRSGFAGVVDLLKTAKHGSGANVYLVGFGYLGPDR